MTFGNNNNNGEVSSTTRQYAYDVKIEQSAKGARITVHAFSDDFEAARHQAVALYMQTADELKQNGVAIAPVETSSAKESKS